MSDTAALWNYLREVQDNCARAMVRALSVEPTTPGQRDRQCLADAVSQLAELSAGLLGRLEQGGAVQVLPTLFVADTEVGELRAVSVCLSEPDGMRMHHLTTRQECNEHLRQLREARDAVYPLAPEAALYLTTN